MILAMMILAAEALAANRKSDPGPVPDGVALVRANHHDHGAGFFASIRLGKRTLYVVGTDRDDAMRQPRSRARSLGLRPVEVAS